MTDNTEEIRIIKYNYPVFTETDDLIVREEPLEIYVNGEKKYFCMRMPGKDYELALGLLYNEGLISSLSDVENAESGDGRFTVKIRAAVSPGIRKVYASSGGMFSDEMILPQSQGEGFITADKLFNLQSEFFSMQNVFDKSGGTHASAFYTSDAGLISFAEDVGRHNALDKCMGSALAAGQSGSIFLILLSSRISFEMIRKSFRTGAAVVAGVSAPTSAAVNAARESGVTLIGFLRGRRFNVYTHPDKILNL